MTLFFSLNGSLGNNYPIVPLFDHNFNYLPLTIKRILKKYLTNMK